MQVTRQELINKLGVGCKLGPYENCPWLVYDGEKGLTCSAEVRAGIDETDNIEAQIDLMHDTPPEGKDPTDHIFRMQAKHINAGNWTIDKAWVRGKLYGEDISGWRERVFNFFSAVVQDLKKDIVPDIDELMERELFQSQRGSDQYGGGGSKAPKFEANQILNPHGKGF